MNSSNLSGARTVLVTGGSGYIGSHTVKALQAEGYRVIILDNLIYGHRDLVETVLKAELIEGDISDRPLLDHLFSTHSIEAVIHFAAYAYVGESTANPAKYYANNVGGTLVLIESMIAAGINQLVFSSTCAIYGIPDVLPILETHPKSPVNPYGKSKLMVEQMLGDFDRAYGLKSVCFRYFNAAGADPSGELGEDHMPEPHLIPLVLEAAAKRREAIAILGTDYPTADGTCIRDYVHVSDLARAHVLGLAYLLQGGGSQVVNLSNGNGFSVREVIKTAEAVTGCAICVQEEARRVGDPPALVGNSDKALQLLGWQPQYPELTDIISHAWHWHQRRHGWQLATSEDSQADKHVDKQAGESQCDKSSYDGLDDQPLSQTNLLVSVVVPAYNAEAFIAETLASVLSQTYRNLEVWVVDDGSSDRTAAIVKKLALEDARINLLQQPNQGVAIARNAGIQAARGDFIAPIDADDLWWPDALEKLVAKLQSAPANVGVAYAWSVDIDEHSQPNGAFHAALITGDVCKTLICHNFLGNASSTLIRKACLEKIGGYSAELRRRKAQGCEDWDLYLRLAEHYKFEVVPEFLVGYRKLTSSMSQDFSQMARSQQIMLEDMRQKHPEIPFYLYRLSFSSFYLYLAQQCDRSSRSSRTLFWLKQAIKIDPITPLLRPGLYVLFLKNWIRQMGWNVRRKSFSKQRFSEQNSLTQHSRKETFPSADSAILKSASGDSLNDLMRVSSWKISPKIHRLKIFLKISVGSVLHHLLLGAQVPRLFKF